MVILRLHGGNLSPDVNVHYPEVAKELPGALAKIINDDTIRKIEVQALKNRLSGKRDSAPISNENYINYVADVLTDTTRKMYYTVLPGRILGITGDKGLKEVGPLDGTPFVPVVSRAEMAGLEDVVDNSFYWIERSTTDQRIYFKNFNASIDKVLVTAILSPDSLADADTVPISEHLESDLVNYMVSIFTGQRQMPEDETIDNSDEHENRDYRQRR